MAIQPATNRKMDELNAAFCDFYRCPEAFATFTLIGKLSEGSGYFHFGPDTVCYGRTSPGFRAARATDELYDVGNDLVADGTTLGLPFNPSEISANLRYERYASKSDGPGTASRAASALRAGYYLARPLLPVSVRKHLQRMRLNGWKKIAFPHWPVDTSVERMFERLLISLLQVHSVERIPFIWFWPDGYPSCAIMTHDVETARGRDFCPNLMDLDDAYAIKSSFQIVPEERYSVSEAFLSAVRDRGFEINVHDLNHDGGLVCDRQRFLQRAAQINRYGRAYRASGFRSAALYRNLDWWEDLEFSYDMSVPSVGNLEAQQGGCCSVMPFFVGKVLELPVTTVQDYSLFHILNQYSIDLWVRQIALLSKQHGLLSFIVHPDYISEPRAQDTYKSLLAYLADLRSEGKIWIALPREVNQWWRDRSQMRLARRGSNWEIEGPGSERAQIAFAQLEGKSLVYRLDPGYGGGPTLPKVPCDGRWENRNVSFNCLP